MQEHLNADLKRILATPAIHDQPGGMSVEMAPGSTTAFARLLRADAEKWGAPIGRLGIEAI